MTRWRAAGLVAVLALGALAGQAGDAKDKPGTQQEPPVGYTIPEAPPLSPADALAAFVIEPGLRVELAAAEPLVVAPVAMQFDADGRLWVVEMRGYMPDADGKGEDAPNGAIAVLEDRDADGVFEKRTTFLDGLVLPRAVCVLHDAVLVLAPPRLLLCPDRDGDLRADTTIEVANGMDGLASPEHAANGLLWALDNRIYLAKYAACFRVIGNGLVREASPALGQWGISQDDLGRLFYNDNSVHLRVDLLPRQLAAANPHLGRAPGLDHLPSRDQRVWPVRVTPGVNRGYQAGTLRDGKLTQFTAACSPCVYRGDWLASLRGTVLVCEPSANLVRCAVLSDDAGTLRAAPLAPGRELLASHDERFRPVALAEGPEGALYIADMARGVIQHRLFVTTFLRRQIEARELATPLDRGRIWRIVPQAGRARSPVRLGSASASELVAALAHPAGFVRDSAQRQLILRDVRSAVPLLESLARADKGLGALHALWTLHGLDALTSGVLLEGLFAPTAWRRAAAYEITAAMLARGHDPLLAGALLQRAADEDDPRAARILALVLGRVALPEAPSTLIALVDRLASDDLMPSAALCGLAGREVGLVRSVIRRAGAERRSASSLLSLAATAIVRRKAPSELIDLFECTRAALASPWQAAALLAGIGQGVPRAVGKSVRVASLGRDRAVRAAAEELANALPEPLAATWRELAPAFAAPVDPSPSPVLTAEQQAAFDHGRTLYLVCAGCHGGQGEGTGEAPPLLNSEWVSGSPTRLVRIVLHGLEGPLEVDDQRWDRAMPPVALADADIAAVLTYVRHTFAQAEPVAPSLVREVRAATAKRDKPWTVSELSGQ